jgi:hypothetical protein|tara:strand:+ start:8502 stop:8831 length:330 start_codon:yes stop_codon:yes gene_type:complete
VNKLSTFILLCFLGLSYLSFCQTQSQKKTTPVLETALEPTKVEQIQNQISQIDNHLLAIETKRAYILSSEDETAIANETGWFESMAVIIDQLLEKKQNLISVLNADEND